MTSSDSITGIGKIFGYKTRIGTTIHLVVLGLVTIFSQTGILIIPSEWHSGLIIFMGGQMVAFAGIFLTGLFRSGNPKVRCQNCDAPMTATNYKCQLCNSSFTFGDSKNA